MELEEDTIQTNGRTSSLSDSGLISMCRTSALLKIIATIADGRWREVSRHQAAIQAGIESAQPRLSACIRLMFQAKAPLAADAIEPAQQELSESHHRFDDAEHR